MPLLERLFQLKANGTTVRTEVLAGVTTFLTMAYILFICPNLLGQTGMDKGAVFVATCLTAAIGSAAMGLIANFPVALAPGLGLCAFFTYTVVLQLHYSWQIALGAVFISACAFFLLSVFKLRQWIMESIPVPLRSAIAAGIGLFLAMIGLQSAGLVVASPTTLIALGDIKSPAILMAIAGFFLLIILDVLRVRGAVLISILVVSLLSILLGNTHYQGIIAPPPSLAPTFLKLDIPGAWHVGMISIIFSFLFVDIFDNSGTLIGVARKAGLIKKDGKLPPNMGRALFADSVGAISGSILGASTTTSYIESAAGVASGGRTGLTACVVAILFLVSLFFSPLSHSIPLFATAPALIYIAILMISELAEIDWSDLTIAAPVVITTLAMPLTFSIANGIAFGIISWTVIKLCCGRWRDVNISLIVLSLIFLVKLIWL